MQTLIRIIFNSKVRLMGRLILPLKTRSAHTWQCKKHISQYAFQTLPFC